MIEPKGHFQVNLPRIQVAEKWRSEGAEVNEKVAHLQRLFDENIDNGKAYAEELARLKSEGHQFRLTRGKVYQIFESDKTLDVPIRLQIKEGVITWYFIAPQDKTKQKFRDEVYESAGLAHLKVDHACEKYLRGTNALHVKKMHTKETEALYNHNHYRLMEGHDVTPTELRQHLMGFVEAQRKLELFVDSEGGGKTEKFLTTDEAEEILKQYEEHWLRITHKGDAKNVALDDGRIMKLPARESSLLEEYKTKELAKWDAEDWAEWNAYKGLEQPCKTIFQSDDLPLATLRTAAQKAMRGIRAEFADTRQIKGSKLQTKATVVEKDDEIAALAAKDKTDKLKLHG